MELLIRPVADLQLTRSWEIYGRSGTGKTTFASTFPGPTLLLDIEDHGTDSISDCNHIDIIQVTKWSMFDEIYDMLISRNNKYRCVIWDTCTMAQLLGANHVLAKKRKPQIAQFDWGSMTIGDWGDLGALMKEKITLFRNLPMEVVFLAQERISTNDEGRDDSILTPEVGPALSPAIASHLNACVSIIAGTFIKRRRRKRDKRPEEITAVYSLRIGPSPIYTTKVRKPRSVTLPSDIDNPTWQDVVDIIEGNE